MLIERIGIYHVSMPLRSPWRTAYGEDAAIESILIRIESGDHIAWTEVSPLAAPCYSPDWASGTFALLKKWMIPAVIGKELSSGVEVQRQLAHFKGNPFAKAAIDSAWWVLESQMGSLPLHRLLGATRDSVDVGADFGVPETLGNAAIDRLVAQIGQAVEAGFRRIKLKFCPGWDLKMLAAVRSNFPHETIHIDCNAGYTLADIGLFRQLDRFQLAMIEQPLAHDDLIDHAQLQAAIKTPICLDESITSPGRARKAIELKSCGYINVKPARVGGITPSVEIHNLCKEADMPCWVGGMLESAIGARLAIALAMLDRFTYPADIFPSTRFYKEDLSGPHIVLSSGEEGQPQVAALSEPGIGATPDLDRLERDCLDHAEFSA